MMRRLVCLTVGLLWSSWLMASVTLTTLTDEAIPFEDLKGKWVLINYWASWCGPCLQEIATLNRFYQTHRNDVALFAIAADDLSPSETLVVMKKLHIQYPGLQVDPGPELGIPSIRGVPVTFIFDPTGELRDTRYGPQSMAALNAAIK